MTVVEVFTAIGAIATALAFGAAIVTIHQNTVARNLQTVAEVARKLSDIRQQGFALGVYGEYFQRNPGHVHIYQMCDFIEHLAFIVNHKLVSGPAAEFLTEWLRIELKNIYDQPMFVDHINATESEALSEMKRLRWRFETEAVDKKVAM